MSITKSALALCALTTVEGENWNWDTMTEQRGYNGADASTFKHFDTNYMMGLIGTNGDDPTIVHQKHSMPTVGLTSMEKVVALTSVSTRASIRSQLVDLLKKQVRIESMYGTKKEKLYMSASAVYDFIGRLLHSACSIALGNDGLWKEQMQCFSAYRQLLEVYAMWNGIRDIAFALEHGMAVTVESLSVCGPNAIQEDKFAGQTVNSQRLQNQYLVSATLRACYDSLQVRIEGLRRWLSQELVSMESSQDRGESCLFRTITVLTCLSSGNQENVLDLAIKEEHKQHVVFGLARYASVALRDQQSPASSSLLATGSNSTDSDGVSASFVEVDANIENHGSLREIRKLQ